MKEVIYVNGKAPRGKTKYEIHAVFIPISKPFMHIIVTIIVNYILMKSVMKLPIQYALSCIPEISCKCFKPSILSTTK